MERREEYNVVDIDLLETFQKNMALEIRTTRENEWTWRCKIAFAVLNIAVWIMAHVIGVEITRQNLCGIEFHSND